MFTVVITEKGGAQRHLQFDESEVTIGRVQGNDVVLPKGNVSKRHSRIVLKDNRFIVVDLKSTNGTYVNGRKITSPLVVKEGDKIYIGDFILTLDAQAAERPAVASQPPEQMQAPSALPPVLGEVQEEKTSGGVLGQGASEAPALPSRPPAAPGAAARKAGVEMRAPPPLDARMRRTTAADVGPPSIAHAADSSGQRSSEAPAAAARSSEAPAPAIRSGKSSLPPAMQDDLRNVMDRLGYELDERLAPRASRPELLAEAERAIDGAIGQMRDQGSLDSSVDRDALKGAAMREAVGLGPLDELLDEGTVQRIEISRYDRIYVDRGQGPRVAEGTSFSSARAMDTALRRLARASGSVPADACHASFELADGTHVSVIWPPLASGGPAAVFSRRPAAVRGLTQLQGMGMLDEGQAQTLRAALSARDNVLVVGPRSANISAVANALLAQLERHNGVLTIEHAAELGPAERVRVGLRWPARGLAELLAQANAFQVDRWFLHGAPPEEAAVLLPALAARSDGSVCTLYAPSLDAALDDLRAHLAGLGERAEPLLAAAFPVAVEVSRKAKETRVQHVTRLRVEGGRTSAA